MPSELVSGLRDPSTSSLADDSYDISSLIIAAKFEKIFESAKCKERL